MRKEEPLEEEFQYYATFNDQGEIHTVFRMGDPEFMLAFYRHGYWRDGWYMYRRMTKGDGPDAITEAEALAAIAREPVAAEPLPSGPVLPSFEERRETVAWVREQWAKVPVPPGIESIKSFDLRRR